MKGASLILLLLCWNCGPDLSSSSYGRVKLQVGEQVIFFKRQASALNHDDTVISPSDDLCNIPNPKTDYVFQGAPPAPLFYKIEKGVLILFVSTAATPPESGKFPVKIVQNEPNPLEMIKLTEAPEKDMKRLELPLNNHLKCLH